MFLLYLAGAEAPVPLLACYAGTLGRHERASLALVGKRVALVSRFFMYAIVRASFCQKLLVDFLPIGILLVQFSIISYNIIVGNYVLCPGERRLSDDSLVIKKPSLLSKERFEKYMQEDKPYLNPELKITDLTRELQTNRTYLSTFINRTYGMNFKAYINDCRLREMEALLLVRLMRERA